MSSCGSTNCGCGSGCSCGSSCNCESSIIEQAAARTLVVGVAPTSMMLERSMKGAECGCGDDCSCDPCTCDEV